MAADARRRRARRPRPSSPPISPTATRSSRRSTTLIDELGGVDVLVNNAGSSRAGNIEQVDDDAWRESFDLKLMGYVRSMRLVIPAMRAQGSGCIVNVLGVAGTQPSPNYVLSCFVTALQQLTASVADQGGAPTGSGSSASARATPRPSG